MARFNPETRELILQGVRDGLGFERASIMAGVSDSTRWRWERRGKIDRAAGKNTAYARFADDLRAAEANAVAVLERTVYRQATSDEPGDWRCAAWLLSRRRPLEYGETKTLTKALEMEAIRELMCFLERQTQPATYAEVLDVLAARVGADPEALPG